MGSAVGQGIALQMCWADKPGAGVGAGIKCQQLLVLLLREVQNGSYVAKLYIILMLLKMSVKI